jgi:hypothetical protein
MKVKRLLRAGAVAAASAVSVCATLSPAPFTLASTLHRAHGRPHNSMEMGTAPIQTGGAVLTPSSGKLTLIGARRYRAHAASADGDCYIKTEKNKKFKGYKPWHTTEQGVSYITDWLNQLYSVSDARYLQGEHETFQVQFCAVGGGNTHHSWHEWFVGEALFYKSTSDRKIKWTWGKGASKSGGINTTLSFSVAKGPATIGASTTVTTGVGSYEGDFGSDGHFTNYPKKLVKYNLNRINTYFVSPHTWPWDGTSSFEGNTGQVVYEWSMSYARTHSLHFEDAVQIRGFCATALGVCSKPW